EVDELRRPEGVGLSAHADHAVPQAPPERAERLPLQAVDRVAGRLPLRDAGARELAAPPLVVALRAGEVQLTLAQVEGRSPGLDERLHPRVVRDRDRHAARLPGEPRGQCEEIAAFVSERRGLLAAGAAGIDALFEADRALRPLVPRGVAGRDAL